MCCDLTGAIHLTLATPWAGGNHHMRMQQARDWANGLSRLETKRKVQESAWAEVGATATQVEAHCALQLRASIGR